MVFTVKFINPSLVTVSRENEGYPYYSKVNDRHCLCIVFTNFASVKGIIIDMLDREAY